MLDDIAVRARQNVGLVTAVLLFCILYLLYNLAHPKGFSSAVLVQNGDEIFALAMTPSYQSSLRTRLGHAANSGRRVSWNPGGRVSGGDGAVL